MARYEPPRARRCVAGAARDSYASARVRVDVRTLRLEIYSPLLAASALWPVHAGMRGRGTQRSGCSFSGPGMGHVSGREGVKHSKRFYGMCAPMRFEAESPEPGCGRRVAGFVNVEAASKVESNVVQVVVEVTTCFAAAGVSGVECRRVELNAEVEAGWDVDISPRFG